MKDHAGWVMATIVAGILALSMTVYWIDRTKADEEKKAFAPMTKVAMERDTGYAIDVFKTTIDGKEYIVVQSGRGVAVCPK